MYYIRTAFERVPRLRALASVIFNDETNDVTFLPLYLKGTSQTLYEIEQSKKRIMQIFKNSVDVNDFKAHLETFELPISYDYDVYSSPDFGYMWERDKNIIQKSLLAQIITAKREQPRQSWKKLAADATIAYLELEKRGILFESIEMYPIYEINTFTGRSKTSIFNIQGIGNDQDIAPMNDTYEYFICADWISADMRVISLLSGDSIMQESFNDSDPYEYISKNTGLTRDECKKGLLSGLYSLSANNIIIDVYPKLRKWIDDVCHSMEKNGYLESILGRKFYLDNDNKKSVFNAAIQGSVVHAMQNTLVKLHQRLPEYILTELHDSIIFCCTRDMVKTIVDDVSNIMIKPFDGLLKESPRFPLRISIGKKWRNWKLFKTVR